MARVVLCLAVAAAFLAAGCSGQTVSDDRSDKVWIKHRVPSK